MKVKYSDLLHVYENEVRKNIKEQEKNISI